MCGFFLRELEVLGERVQFTSFVDLQPERTEEAKNASPIGKGAKTTTDYRDIREEVDGVILAVPHHLHEEMAVFFLNAGKHVLVEKPMAITEADCLSMVKAAEDSEAIAMHGYVMHYSPIVQEYTRLLEKEEFGECFQLSIWTEQFTDDSKRGPWIGQVGCLGGGQTFSHGCHYIDLLLHWLGAPVKGTHLGTNRGTPWMEKEGTSNVTLEFENGSTAYHFGTWGSRGSKLGYNFQAHCTGGLLELDYRAGQIIHWLDPTHGDLGGMSREEMEDPNNQPKSRVVSEFSDVRKHTVEEIAHFLDCIEQNRQPETDLRSGLQSLRVIWRLYEAERRGVVADLRGLSLDTTSLDPDPYLAETKKWGYTCDLQELST